MSRVQPTWRGSSEHSDRPTVAALLGSSHWHLPRPLSASEVRRRLLHMLPGFLPLALWFIPHRQPWGPILLSVVAVLGVCVVATAIARFHYVARKECERGTAAVLGYAFPVLGPLLLLPAHPEIGLTVLGILSLGDGAATLGGLRLGGPALPWNARKSWTGLACFCLGGGTLATLLFWGEVTPPVPLTMVLLCVTPATIAGAIMESLPIRSNDNARVGATSLLVTFVMHQWLMPV